MTTRSVPVVDLFSGPGGLAEGFSACRDSNDRREYRVALSIEKDPAAYRTLLRRAFLHKFPIDDFPPEYYDFLNGAVKEEPDWAQLHPRRWAAACDETRCLELGTHDAQAFLRDRIRRLRAEHGDRTVLVGGPPCQAYSVIGRSRNAGNARYNADEDHRQSLYEEYVRVLGQLRPAVAVMENVKGMLSARRRGEPIFPKVLRSLQRAGDGYRLFALASRSGAQAAAEEPQGIDFLVHADEHGVPQARQRVFVVCVRRDVAEALPEGAAPRLEQRSEKVSASASSVQCRRSAAVSAAVTIPVRGRPPCERPANWSRRTSRRCRGTKSAGSAVPLPAPGPRRPGLLRLLGMPPATACCRFAARASSVPGFTTKGFGCCPTTRRRRTCRPTSRATCSRPRSPRLSGGLRRPSISPTRSRRTTRTGAREGSMIATGCSSPINRPPRSRATSRRTATTSFTPIRRSAGASR